MLESITIEDFKSFGRARAKLGPLTLLVGSIGSGKSNFGEALQVLHGIGLGYSMAEILDEKYNPEGFLQWQGIRGGARAAARAGADSFSIAVDISIPEAAGPGQVFTYRIRVDVSDLRSGPRVVAESLLCPGGFLYDSHPEKGPVQQGSVLQLRVRCQDRKKVLAFSSARPVLTQFAERSHGPAAIRASCCAVRDVLAAMRFPAFDPETIRQPAHPDQRFIGNRGENLTTMLAWISGSDEFMRTVLAWLRTMTPLAVTDFAFPRDHTGKRLLHFVESGGLEISAHSVSDGTLRFLALVTALLSNDSERTYFFEDFDHGIHPTHIHLLPDLVKGACKRHKVQVIGTTHCSALLTCLDEPARSDVLLVTRGEGTWSRLMPIIALANPSQVLETDLLGHLRQAGWFEAAAV